MAGMQGANPYRQFGDGETTGNQRNNGNDQGHADCCAQCNSCGGDCSGCGNCMAGQYCCGKPLDSKFWTYLVRWVAFATYAIGAIAVFGISNGKGSCYVQSTYRQEFMVNTVSNPFISSSSVRIGPTPSQLESEFLNVTSNNQTAGDIAIFPVAMKNAASHAAFLTVLKKPIASVEAGEVLLPIAMDPNSLYTDTKILPERPSSMSSMPLAMQRMMLMAFGGMIGNISLGEMPLAMQQLVQGLTVAEGSPVQPGTLLPNYERCFANFYKEDSDKSKQMKLEDRLMKNSHLRGTCLFTGQQAMVDVTSNYKTSLILFSSVNVLFLTALVLWISASFSLFHIGGLLKTKKRDAEVVDHYSEPDECCAGCNFITCDDFLMLLAILWNTIAVVFICSGDFRASNSIPLNNAVLGIFALIASIMVQWGWANFKIFNIQAHDEAAQMALEDWGRKNRTAYANYAMAQQNPKGQSITPMEPRMNSMESNTSQNGSTKTTAPANNIFDVFTTEGFLGTGARVDYTHHDRHAHTHSSTSSTYTNLRHRNPVARMMNEYTQSRQKLAAMPHYAAMVKLGAPIVQYNYINHLKKEMMADSVQSLEYTITNPILLATILAAASPTVPTAMVQYAFGCMLASHILCMPIMYIGHLTLKHEKASKDAYWWYSSKVGVVMLLVACATYQGVALYIKGSYIFQTSDFYYLSGHVAGSAALMIVSQTLFVIVVLIVVVLNISHTDSGNNWVANSSYYMYVTLNFICKAIAVPLLVQAADGKQFPVFTCSVWRGLMDPVAMG